MFNMELTQKCASPEHTGPTGQCTNQRVVPEYLLLGEQDTPEIRLAKEKLVKKSGKDRLYLACQKCPHFRLLGDAESIFRSARQEQLEQLGEVE